MKSATVFRQHICDNIFMITGWPGSSGLVYSFETGNYTIQVNEHDDPDEFLERGLEEIEKRETEIARVHGAATKYEGGAI